MKNNFERYHGQRAFDCERTTLVTYLVGHKADSIIRDKLALFKNCNVLELGCGSGRFTRGYYRQNRVTVIDINPQLFPSLPGVKMIAGNVSNIESLIPPPVRYDLIFAGWLTEYLGLSELMATMRGCRKRLQNNGTIIFTFVDRGLLGSLYIVGARLKGIKKFNYSVATIKRLAAKIGLAVTEVKKMRRLGFGYLVTLKINGSDTSVIGSVKY